MEQDNRHRRTKGNLKDFREAFELLISGNATEEEQERLKSFLSTDEGKEEFQRLMAGENGKKLVKYITHASGLPDRAGDTEEYLPTLDTRGHGKEQGELDSIREAALLSKREKQEREWAAYFAERFKDLPTPEDLDRLLQEVRETESKNEQEP